MERTRKWWVMTSGGLAAATLATVVALAGPATAAPTDTTPATTSPSSTSAPAGTAKPKYCDHLEKALDRHQKTVDRWNGDASQRGSIAWLQARAATVAATDPQLSTLLNDRAALRSQAKGPAATVIADLQAVHQARCAT